MPREVLVTGATGFIGGHLTRALMGRGDRVTAVVRDRRRAEPLERAGARVLEVDLLDESAMRQALAGISVVFHLAGGGVVSTSSAAGLETLRRANVQPLRVLLSVSRALPIERIVHFSSISAMGVQLDVLLDEDSPCLARTPHEIAKRESEVVALDAWATHGTPVTILRPSQVYGPGDVRSEILKLARLVRRGVVPLFDGGMGLVPWVYVSDVVDAALAAADRPETSGRTYIVSDREPYRFRDVVSVMAGALRVRRGGFYVPTALARLPIAVAEAGAKLVGREPPFTVHRLESMCGARRVSIAKAARELGFAPKVSLETGMAMTMSWYRDTGRIS